VKRSSPLLTAAFQKDGIEGWASVVLPRFLIDCELIT
jgi:hypothetical protein